MIQKKLCDVSVLYILCCLFRVNTLVLTRLTKRFLSSISKKDTGIIMAPCKADPLYSTFTLASEIPPLAFRKLENMDKSLSHCSSSL